jgi:ATP-dependent DNA ligase
MFKIKHARTADCVVAGFRWHKAGPGELVGSLLLGLYDDNGRLHHVGVTRRSRWRAAASWSRSWHRCGGGARRSPVARVGGRRERRHADARRQSRWSAGKDLSWEPLRIERVCEVKYDHMQGDRFRHAATFQRWRLDKAPGDCRYDQLEVTAPYELAKVFGARASDATPPSPPR